MERLPTWVSLFCLSIVLIASALDEVPADERSGNARANYCLAAAIITLIVSFLFIVANLIDRIGHLVVGNVVENVISTIIVALWVVAITFIQNPKYGSATDINDEGQEIIVYANLYFFSWLNFATAIYLFGNVIRDNLAYNPKFSQWVLLFASSVVLTATSTALHDEICDKATATSCDRLKYALAVGSVGIILCFISIIATMFGFMGAKLEFGTSFLCAAFYFFGVVILTSASGPATALGNMYFSVWVGTFLSFTLLLAVIFPNRGNAAGNDTHGIEHQGHDMDHDI